MQPRTTKNAFFFPLWENITQVFKNLVSAYFRFIFSYTVQFSWSRRPIKSKDVAIRVATTAFMEYERIFY